MARYTIQSFTTHKVANKQNIPKRLSAKRFRSISIQFLVNVAPNAFFPIQHSLSGLIWAVAAAQRISRQYLYVCVIILCVCVFSFISQFTGFGFPTQLWNWCGEELWNCVKRTTTKNHVDLLHMSSLLVTVRRHHIIFNGFSHYACSPFRSDIVHLERQMNPSFWSTYCVRIERRMNHFHISMCLLWYIFIWTARMASTEKNQK